MSGFQLTSYGLPGIRGVEVEPNIDPPPGVTGWDALDAFYRQFAFRTSTVGPKAPPQHFVPLEFVNYLITLLHDSRQLGWVREKEEHQKLLKTLLGAKRRLERNEPGKAAHRLEKFVERVEKDACRDFRCRKEMALTSEAFALLFFNGRYLLDRLPQPHRGHDDDRDDDKDD